MEGGLAFAYMRVFECVVCVVMLDEKRGKFVANDTKCLLLGYCKRTKAYRLMFLQIKNIIKSRNMVLMEYSMSVGNNLEMCPSGRIEGLTVVVVDKSSKLSSCNDGKEPEEEVGDHLVANEKPIKILAGKDSRVERFSKNGRYSKRKWRPSITFNPNTTKNGPMWHFFL